MRDLSQSTRRVLKAYLKAVEVQAELLMRRKPPLISAGDYEGDLIDAGARLATAFVRRNQFCRARRAGNQRNRTRCLPKATPESAS